MNDFTKGEKEFIRLHYGINVNQLNSEEEVEDLAIEDFDSPLIRKIKDCLEQNKTSWKLSKMAYYVLTLACGGEVTIAKYILNKLDPHPNQIIKTIDILKIAPWGVYSNDPDFKEWWEKNYNTIDDVFKR